jgi:hypothetical protein
MELERNAVVNSAGAERHKVTQQDLEMKERRILELEKERDDMM